MTNIHYTIFDEKYQKEYSFKSTSALKRYITSEVGGNGRNMCRWIKKTIYGGETGLQFKGRFVIIKYTVNIIKKYEKRGHKAWSQQLH